MRQWLVGGMILFLAQASNLLAAGGEKGDIELGLYGGIAQLDDYGTGVGSFAPDDDVLFGGRFGVFFAPRWSIEFSGQRLSTMTQFDPVLAMPDVDVDIDSVRANFLYNFRPGKRFRPFLTLGGGIESTDVAANFNVNDPSYNGGAGLRWFLTERFGLRLDGRYVATDVGGAVDDRQSNVEGTFGLTWAFGGRPPADSDGDGVNDRRDKCPDTPRGAIVDTNGCPEDSDGDGVPDGIDKCPGTATGVPVDAKGCPRDTDGDGVHDGIDKCPDTPRGAVVDAAGCPKDADGDGVPDGIDKCPETPRGATVDARGCPKDTDGDGVPDGIDKCPDTPRGATVDAAGCPKDTDGDGVPDGIDKCPGTPAGKKVDAKGCEVLFEEQRRTLVLEGVTFEFNSATLTAQAREVLGRVAASLKEWPQIRVEVAGHTDSVGDDAYNQRLSERRAQSVADYLAQSGVDKSRMTAKGYGEARPIADNTTEAGRDKNRRVELKRLD